MTLLVVSTYGKNRSRPGKELRRAHQRFRFEALHIKFDECRIERCERRIKFSHTNDTGSGAHDR